MPKETKKLTKKQIQQQIQVEDKEDNKPKRADYKLRNYAEDNLIEDINKLQKQIKKLEQSINEHDLELEEKRMNHQKLKHKLQEMIMIQELLNKIQL